MGSKLNLMGFGTVQGVRKKEISKTIEQYDLPVSNNNSHLRQVKAHLENFCRGSHCKVV